MVAYTDLSEVTASTVTRDTDAAVNLITHLLAPADVLKFEQPSTSGHNASPSIMLRRTADYSGAPSAGWKNHGISSITTVDSGANGDEWGITGCVRSSGLGEAVGTFGQGWRVAGDAPAWGCIGDAQDQTNLGEASGRDIHGAEFDCLANGTNSTYQNRIGAMIVSGRPTSGAGTTGAASQCWFGLYVTSVNGTTEGYYKHGIYVGTNEALGGSRLVADIGSKILADGTYGYVDMGAKTTGFRAEGSYTGPVYYGENTTTLSSIVNSVVTSVEYRQKTGANSSKFIVDHLRAQSGSNWDTTTMRFYRKVDSTIMGAVEFRNLTDISFNRSIALTMDGIDFYEANLLKGVSTFGKPVHLKPQASNPSTTNLASGQSYEYTKGDKRVIVYNDAGTIRYITMSLSGAGARSWVTSTTAP